MFSFGTEKKQSVAIKGVFAWNGSNGSQLCTNKDQESYWCSLIQFIILKTQCTLLLLGVMLQEKKNINIDLLISNKLNICLKGKSQTEGQVLYVTYCNIMNKKVFIARKIFLLLLNFIQPSFFLFWSLGQWVTWKVF